MNLMVAYPIASCNWSVSWLTLDHIWKFRQRIVLQHSFCFASHPFFEMKLCVHLNCQTGGIIFSKQKVTVNTTVNNRTYNNWNSKQEEKGRYVDPRSQYEKVDQFLYNKKPIIRRNKLMPFPDINWVT